MKNQLGITLSTDQREVYENGYNNKKYRHFLIYGAARSGKSTLSLYHKINVALNNPNTNILFIMDIPKLVDLFFCVDFLERAMGGNLNEDYFRAFYKRNKNTNSLDFGNGSVITFGNKSTIDILDSNQFDYVVIDGINNYEPEKIEFILNSLDKENGVLECIQNPRRRTDWEYIYFYEKCNPVQKPLEYEYKKIGTIKYKIPKQKEREYICGSPLSKDIVDKMYIGAFHRNHNLENVPDGYYKNLMDNLSEEDIKKYVDSEYL
jgi:hypothetical protein